MNAGLSYFGEFSAHSMKENITITIIAKKFPRRYTHAP
jgi:hypothetical protein